jgi:hypothetical protein
MAINVQLNNSIKKKLRNTETKTESYDERTNLHFEAVS